MDQSKTDYIFRLYAPGDEEKIIKLLIDVFVRWPGFDIKCSKLDHWKWKFIDNPANKGTYPHTVAEIDGEIVGVNHGMLFNVKVGNKVYLSQKGVDVATSNDHRGKGIFRKLDNLKVATVESIIGPDYYFNYSVSANPFTKTEELEYPFPQPLKYLVRINDVDKHFKRTEKDKTLLEKTFLQTGVRGLKTVSRLTNLAKKPPHLKDVTFREITRFDDRIDAFYEKIKPHYNFIVERTVDHMNWRYCDKRGGDYKVWIAEKGNEIVGYLVLRVNRIDPDYPEGHIMDLLALNDRGDVAENLTKFAVDYFDDRGLNVVHAQIIGGHPYERILGNYGLLDTMIKPHLVYRAVKLGDDLERFVKSPPAMLHYTHGEGDSI